MVMRSTRRWMEASTRGTASLMKPGLLPVAWIELAPSAHAASTLARTSGFMLGG